MYAIYRHKNCSQLTAWQFAYIWNSSKHSTCSAHCSFWQMNVVRPLQLSFRQHMYFDVPLLGQWLLPSSWIHEFVLLGNAMVHPGFGDDPKDFRRYTTKLNITDFPVDSLEKTNPLTKQAYHFHRHSSHHYFLLLTPMNRVIIVWYNHWTFPRYNWK